MKICQDVSARANVDYQTVGGGAGGGGAPIQALAPRALETLATPLGCLLQNFTGKARVFIHTT